MIQWCKRAHCNIVVFPENTECLMNIHKKLKKIFPDAQSLENYRFPAAIYQKDILHESVNIDKLMDLLSSAKDLLLSFRAEEIIVQDNHILLRFKPAAPEAASSLDALIYLIKLFYPGTTLGSLVMPLVWLPPGELFPDSILEEIGNLLRKNPLEITVNLQYIEALPNEAWRTEWGRAYGSLLKE